MALTIHPNLGADTGEAEAVGLCDGSFKDRRETSNGRRHLESDWPSQASEFCEIEYIDSRFFRPLLRLEGLSNALDGHALLRI